MDLAWAALVLGSSDLASQALRLEETLGKMVDKLDFLLLAAARGRPDAFVGVLRVVRAVKNIGDAAHTIADAASASARCPTRSRGTLTGAVSADANPAGANRVFLSVPVPGGSPLAGCKLSEALGIAGAFPLALRSGPEWLLAPSPEERLSYGNVLYLRSPQEAVEDVLRALGVEPASREARRKRSMLPGSHRAVRALARLKNLSEDAFDLSCAALCHPQEEFALEVAEMPRRAERLRAGLLGSFSSDSGRPGGKLAVAPGSVAGIAVALERSVGQAREMSRAVARGEEVHPVVPAALDDSRGAVAQLEVAPWSEAEGRTPRALRLEARTGLRLLAAGRDGRWRFLPRGGFVVRGGDLLVASGPPEGAERLAALCR